MNVLFVSAEVTPFAKVGGLADVAGALPKAIQRLGVDIRIVMPHYEHLTEVPTKRVIRSDLTVPFRGELTQINVTQTSLPGTRVPVYLIGNETYLGKGPIYDEHGLNGPFADIGRFFFFSKAVVTMIPSLGWKPDLIHCNDWHAGILPALLTQETAGFPTVFTIHNLVSQGVWNANEALGILGVKSEGTLRERDSRGDLNCVQQGVLGATMVNTVSPQYAMEILTAEFGEGLESTLRRRSGELVGILNGIDTDRFNPATDVSIRVKYDRKSSDGKREDKLALHELCGFSPDADIPTFGFVGRLTEQKGFELIAANARALVRMGARLVILGSGTPDLEEKAKKLVMLHHDHVFCKIGFDAAFAQQVYAGSDFFLMPSRFEPCGMGQMIAMRYGTVPIVRATGGLKDTVMDFDASPRSGVGFTFDAFDEQSLGGAVLRAMSCYHRAEQWKGLVIRCMDQDFSWDRSARSYLSLYEACRKKFT